MKKLAFLSVAVVAVALAIFLTYEPASGGGGVDDGSYSVHVAINVQDDPGGHHQFIQMPENIKLTVLVKENEFGERDISIEGPSPWVDVEDTEIGDDFGIIAFSATGLGTVAGNPNIAMRFTGNFEPENLLGEQLTGKYSMGIEHVLNMAPGPELPSGGLPIVYQIKPKGVPSATPTFTPTPTPTKVKDQRTFTNPGPGAASAVDIFYLETGGTLNSAEVIDETTGCVLDPVVTIDESIVRIDWGAKCAQVGATVTISVRSPLPSISVFEDLWRNLTSEDPTDTPTQPPVPTPTITPFPPLDIGLLTSLPRTGEGVGGFMMNLYSGDGCLPENLIASGLTNEAGAFHSLQPQARYSANRKARSGWNKDLASACIEFGNFFGGSQVNFCVDIKRDGDINNDGLTNSVDASLLLQFAAGLLTDLPKEAEGDVNGDGMTNAVDASLVLQLTAGFIPRLPIGPECPKAIGDEDLYTPTPSPSATPSATPLPAGTKHIFSFTNTGQELASSLEVMFEEDLSIAGFDAVDDVDSVLIVDDFTGCDFPPEIDILLPGLRAGAFQPEGPRVFLDWGEKCVEVGGKVTVSIVSRNPELELLTVNWFSEDEPLKTKHEFLLRNPGPTDAARVYLVFEAPFDELDKVEVILDSSSCENAPGVTVSLPDNSAGELLPVGPEVVIDWGVKCVGVDATVLLSVFSLDPVSLISELWFNDPLPTPTPTPGIGKLSITIAGGPNRSLHVYDSDVCFGSPFASLSTNSSLSLRFSPGTYSIFAEDTDGWNLVEIIIELEPVPLPPDPCQEFELEAGQKIAMLFAYEQTAGQLAASRALGALWHRVATLF